MPGSLQHLPSYSTGHSDIHLGPTTNYHEDDVHPSTSQPVVAPDRATLTAPTPPEDEPYYPRQSNATQEVPRCTGIVPTTNNSVSKKAREDFLLTLPTNVQTKLNQKFGKENLKQCFKSEACLRLVLLPLYNSGYLNATNDRQALAEACRPFRMLLQLLKEHEQVDFRPLQGYQQDWRTATSINPDRIRMATAALLHYEGDVAAVVRWIGGPHVGEHRDIDATLAFLTGKIDAVTLTTLERCWRHGVPAQCNAEASEENFQAYLKYGNHATVDEEPEKTNKTLLKDNLRGYNLLFDIRMVNFTLNCHVTPNGISDLHHPYKTPRPIFDSTFRPEAWCEGINDWTSKVTEPPLHFGKSFERYLSWIYNLRITYPFDEIYAGDDDVSGAFRHGKYHPNLVAMHTCVIDPYMSCATGMTFGDNTSPSNFEPLADARRQLAQYLWLQGYDTIRQARQYMPVIELAAPPTRAEVALFTRADPDALNPGVLDSLGNRLPPQFDHHVDDNVYAETGKFMNLAVSSSVLSLYHTLGFPKPETPDPMSQDKFNTKYNHQRTSLGYLTDTRLMEVAITQEKRDRMVATLLTWVDRKEFTLREISSLHGSLESITRYAKWARPLFFALQNAIRHQLNVRYQELKRYYHKTGRKETIKRSLRDTHLERFDALVARDMAQLLWSSKATIPMTNHIRASLITIQQLMDDPTCRWSQPIGHIIERMPHFHSLGDASLSGGGAYNETLMFWLDIVWSKKVRDGVKLKSTDPNFVHINALEYVIVILQLAAAIVRMETLSAERLAAIFPNGVPAQPVMLCRTDNTAAESWSNRVTSKSLRGQQLIGMMAELLRTRPMGLNALHIAGALNILADYISRPTNFDLSHAERSEQIFQIHPAARTWDYFQPSPELLQSLYSLLFSGPSQGLPSLPKNLGQFVPAGSTTSYSPTL